MESHERGSTHPGRGPSIPARSTNEHLRIVDPNTLPPTSTPSLDASAAEFAKQVVAERNRADRAAVGLVLRVALGAVALTVLFRGASKLIGSSESHHDVHAARHLGTFVAAYAVALAAVVHKPSRARSILPIAIFVAATLLLTAAFDLSEDLTPLSRELLHAPEIAGAVLVWLIARRNAAAQTNERHRPRDRSLRAVE